ncbi:glycosyltransferase family 2 protein [Helicobacter sp. 23-1044]
MLISIIIPIYNVEKYIARCLTFCINQTFSNIEILLIDDCGSDDSIKISQSFAKKDKRIKIIKNPYNLGLFHTRIVGEKHAKGHYILPLDADDFISQFTCKILHRAICGTNAFLKNIKLFRNILIGGGII